MACSSSKRNSARARAVSVLPTPVGPRKMKLPMGRLGSLRPARERRIALATTCRAPRPGRRRARAGGLPSAPASAPRLPASCETGMPVHLLTILAMSSSSTSSFNMRACRLGSALLLGVQLLQLGFELGQLAVLDVRRRAPGCPCASALPSRSAAPRSASSARRCG